MKFYLGGPIRPNNIDDVVWRFNISKIDHTFNNPLDNNKSEDLRTIGELDFIMLNSSEAGIFNFNEWGSYPHIGALVEIGYLTAQNKPVFIVTKDKDLPKHPMLTRCVFFDTFEQLVATI